MSTGCFCGKPGVFACETCGTPYCSLDCQVKEWPRHRIACLKIPTIRRIRCDILHGSVAIGDLAYHMAEGGPEREFVSMSQESTNPNATFNAAMACENYPKNRHTNVLASDQTRVFFGEHNAYINASHVDEGRAIITQSPLASTAIDTRADFWEMAWSKNVSVVIALTGDAEIHAGRASLYWPKTSSKSYGEFRLENREIVPSDENVVHRILDLHKKEAVRTIHHFQYLNWPDGGVPTDTGVILNLMHDVDVAMRNSVGPLIVHCSAGVGRAGTFMLIRVALRYIREQTNSCINMSEMLTKLRMERDRLVQRVEQYKFAYRAVLDESIHMGLISTPSVASRIDIYSVGSWMI